MTPSAFVSHYGGLANEAAAGASVSRWTVLAQWAVETGWGSSSLAIDDHNLAGIRWYGHAGTSQVGGTPGKVGTGFARYGSLQAFVSDYIRTLDLLPYRAVRAAVSIEDQLRALGRSPWDAGHYLRHGIEGGSLIDAWHAMPAPSAAVWTLHIAPHAEVRTYPLGAGGCIDGGPADWPTERWGGGESSAPCHEPIGRHQCGSSDHAATTATVTAGHFAGKVVRVSHEHGVTVTRRI